MPTQIFKIMRPPEEMPLTEQELFSFLYKNRPKSEWAVKEIKLERIVDNYINFDLPDEPNTSN